jgi:hypothetical protein
VTASARPSGALDECPIGPKADLGSSVAMPPAWKLSKHRRFINGFAVGFIAVLFLGVGIHIATLFSINNQMAAFEPGTPVFSQPPPASSEASAPVFFEPPRASSEAKGDQLPRGPAQASKTVTIQSLPAGAHAPAAAEAPVRKLSSDEIERLIRRGREAIVEGNIDRARLALKLAAEAGDATAALELGGTYDLVIVREIIKKLSKPPRVVQSMGVVASKPVVVDIQPIVANIAEAKVWYEKARDLGSAEAAERLKRLR